MLHYTLVNVLTSANFAQNNLDYNKIAKHMSVFILEKNHISVQPVGKPSIGSPIVNNTLRNVKGANQENNQKCYDYSVQWKMNCLTKMYRLTKMYIVANSAEKHFKQILI